MIQIGVWKNQIGANSNQIYRMSEWSKRSSYVTKSEHNWITQFLNLSNLLTSDKFNKIKQSDNFAKVVFMLQLN